MEPRTLAAACLVLAACPLAYSQTSDYVRAHDGFSFVDGFYVWQDVEFAGGDSSDADGWGLKARYAFATNFFASGEWATSEFDDSDVDLDQWRLGGGFSFLGGDMFLPYVSAHYVDFEIDGGPGGGSVGLDGPALHVGAHFPVSERFRLYAEGGYLFLDDADGWELAGGAAFRITGVEHNTRGGFGVFADYRFTDLEVDDTDEDAFEIGQARVGARFEF